MDNIVAEPEVPNPIFLERESTFAPVAFASFADFEVEYELIGSILRKGSVYEEVAGTLNVDMFHNEKCKDIFNAMGKVREHGLVLDSITVQDQLDRDGTLNNMVYDAFTGRAAIGKIRERGNPKNVESYVEIILDYWAKRQVDVIAQQMATHARNGRRAVDILSDTRAKLDDIDILGGKVSNKTYSSSKTASILWDHAESASRGELKGCNTGFVDLDRIITMMSGDLVLVGGRPGQGKSALLDSIALQVAQSGKKVGLFTLEMSTKQVGARMASHISGIPTDRILKGTMTPPEWEQFTETIEVIESLPMSINDQAGLTIPQMRTEARRMMRDLKGLDLLVVDYVQLMKSIRRSKNRNEEVGEITKGLKEIGKEFDVPILAAAQMNRAVEQRSEKRPVLSDLRESGDLENDADIVMFIHRPDQYEKESTKHNVAEIIVAKHRNGPVGTTELVFRGALAKFENASTRVFRPNEDVDTRRIDIHGD